MEVDVVIPETLPADYVVAATAIPTLESGKYYPAFLDTLTNNVYTGPEINEAYALGIIAANTKHFGVLGGFGEDIISENLCCYFEVGGFEIENFKTAVSAFCS